MTENKPDGVFMDLVQNNDPDVHILQKKKK